MLLALLLSQVCSYEGEVCAERLRAPVLMGSQFEGFPNGPVSFISHRNAHDPGADFAFWAPDKAGSNDANLLEMRRIGGQVMFRVGWHGEVIGGGNSEEGAFIAEYAGEGRPILVCRKSSGPLGGCTLLLQSDFDPDNQAAMHGWVTIENKRRGADGGTPLQVIATGRSNASAVQGSVMWVDVYGNVWLPDGMLRNNTRLADRQACVASAPWDGVVRGAGMHGYVDGPNALQLCTPESAQDGGWETVITDRSLAAALAPILEQLAALQTCH